MYDRHPCVMGFISLFCTRYSDVVSRSRTSYALCDLKHISNEILRYELCYCFCIFIGIQEHTDVVEQFMGFLAQVYKQLVQHTELCVVSL